MREYNDKLLIINYYLDNYKFSKNFRSDVVKFKISSFLEIFEYYK